MRILFGLAVLLTSSSAFAAVTVPEPATMGLVATGVGVLALIRRRRGK